MKRILYIHIGNHKPATTTSQRFCYDNSTILKTTDGGANWSTILNNWPDYADVVAINSDTVFFIGQSVWMTTDGGSTNSNIYDELFGEWFSAYFIDSNTGYVVGTNGAIIKTADGGNSWIFFARVCLYGNFQADYSILSSAGKNNFLIFGI